MFDSIFGWIALNLVDGIGPTRSRRLADACGGPDRVFAADLPALASVEGIGPKLAKRISVFPWRERAEQELERCQKVNCRIMTLADGDYPVLLRDVLFPPSVLYFRGQFNAQDVQSLAVVGCRQPSVYGLQAARTLSADLVNAGFAIVSGLALGIDTEAHKSALEAGGRTLAVLAHGLDQVYPPANRALHDRIVESGAVISEFPIGMQPLRENFPQRNRVISGLSRGVLVVEAGPGSGALITARWAMEQNREVFALPGNYHSRLSQGTHALIQDGAKLVTDLQDILAEFPSASLHSTAVSKTPKPLPELTPEQSAIFKALEAGGKHVDQLAAECGQPVPRLLAELLKLEMRGWVQTAPGAVFHWVEP